MSALRPRRLLYALINDRDFVPLITNHYFQEDILKNMDKVINALLDAVLDTLAILPFLLAVHILIELIERSATSHMRLGKMLNGWYAPAVAGALGLIPQCGFSVVATKLFSKNKIRLGTLLAVYIATSDEALPILISEPDAWGKILPLLLIKLVYAIMAGYLINALMRKKSVKAESETIEEKKQEGEDGADSVGCHGHIISRHGHGDPHEHTEGEELPGKTNKFLSFLRFLEHPVLHTLTVTAFIFVVYLGFNLLFEFLGEESILSFLESAQYAQPFIAALIGLIPNCGASVLLTQTYALGGLSLGGAVSGLSVGAGVAYAVLFKENKSLKQNVAIVGGLYLVSALLGLGITLVGF